MWCRYCIAICIHARYRGCIKTSGSVADPAFSSGAVSLAAYVVPWVHFSCLVRSCGLLHNCNPRCGWLVRPYPTGTSTLQETASFLAHNDLELCCPAEAGSSSPLYVTRAGGASGTYGPARRVSRRSWRSSRASASC